MATLQKRTAKDGSISYRVMVRLKGHPVLYQTFSRLSDAKKFGADAEATIRQGKHLHSRKHLVSELIQSYRENVCPTLKSNRETHLTWWNDQLGPYFVQDVTPGLILDTRKRLPCSNSTVNRYCSTMSHVFTHGVKTLFWLESNPFFKVPSLKEPNGVVRFLDDEERERLLLACKSHGEDLYLVVLLALTTGARRGEILNLRWENIDLNQGLLTFPNTKNGKVRHVPIMGPALEGLRQRSGAKGLVFPGKRAGTRHKPISIDNVFKRAVATAGIDDFTFHCIRHTAASYLVMSGVDMRTVAEILGHSDLRVTQGYAHLSRPHVADAIGKLNQRLKI